MTRTKVIPVYQLIMLDAFFTIHMPNYPEQTVRCVTDYCFNLIGRHIQALIYNKNRQQFSDCMSGSKFQQCRILPLLLAISALLASVHTEQSPASQSELQLAVPSGFIRTEEPTEQKVRQYGDSLEFLIQQYYIGTFYRKRDQNLFDYLTSESGTIEAILFKNQLSNSIYEIDSFEILLFDPIYHDQRAVRLELNLEKMTAKNEWSSNSSIASVSTYWKQRTDGPKNVSNVKYRILLSNYENRNPVEVKMQIMIEGPDFQFTATLSYDDARVSTLLYCLYMTVVICIQISCAYLLLKKIDTTNPNIVNKISLSTMAMCNIEDFYLTMVNIEYIMTSRSSTYLFYILPSMCYVTLFVIFDMKMLFLAWRSHYMRQIDNPQALRKKLTTFYIKFYVGLFLYLTLTYFFSFDVWMIIAQNLVLLPQIIHNVRVGIKPGFEPYYIIGYLGARFLIPMYQRGCPSNHFLLTPIVGLVITLFFLYFFQIIILFLQDKLGPRFFVPRIFLPNYYNYNCKVKLSEETKDLQCNICLQNFFAASNTLNLNDSELEETMLKEVNVMKTPCNHYFHRECLLGWTDVKLQCPTCRAVLPPI